MGAAFHGEGGRQSLAIRVEWQGRAVPGRSGGHHPRHRHGGFGGAGRAPAGAALGAAAGFLALVAGIGTADGPFVVVRYPLPGLAPDVALVAGVDPCRSPWRGALAGALAGLLKLAMSLAWAAMVGQSLAWLAAKVVVAASVHAISGALGGIAAAALVGRLRRAGECGGMPPPTRQRCGGGHPSPAEEGQRGR